MQLPKPEKNTLLNTKHRLDEIHFPSRAPVGCNRQNPIRIATREYTSGGIEASHITGKR